MIFPKYLSYNIDLRSYFLAQWVFFMRFYVFCCMTFLWSFRMRFHAFCRCSICWCNGISYLLFSFILLVCDYLMWCYAFCHLWCFAVHLTYAISFWNFMLSAAQNSFLRCPYLISRFFVHYEIFCLWDCMLLGRNAISLWICLRFAGYFSGEISCFLCRYEISIYEMSCFLLRTLF